jgi:hypothetical protein
MFGADATRTRSPPPWAVREDPVDIAAYSLTAEADLVTASKAIGTPPKKLVLAHLIELKLLLKADGCTKQHIDI